MSQEISRLKTKLASLVHGQAIETAENIQAATTCARELLTTNALSQLQANSLKEALPLLERAFNLIQITAGESAKDLQALPAPQEILRLPVRARG
jgi:hypothetical protein